jgi:DNA-binding beta-propeller fold protein YncE
MSASTKIIQAAAGVSTGPEGAWDLSFAYYDDPGFWNVSTASFVQSFSVSSQDTGPEDVFFKPDGTKMYMIGGAAFSDINEYDLSTAWNISTASFLQNFNLAGQDTFSRGVFFKPDGAKMYVVGQAGQDINEYDLSTAWDISTASFLQNFSVASEDGTPESVFFKPDGTKMYVAGNTGNDVNEYDLSTAWDISSASFLQNFSVATQETAPLGMSFKPDGSKMYIVGSTGDDVNEYDLSTAWDISSASFVRLFSVSSQDTIPNGLFFKPEGDKMYVIGRGSDNVNEYDLGGFDVSAQEAQPLNLFFKPDGTKMYIIGGDGDEVNEYDLSTAWDVSTASFLQSFSVATQETVPSGLFFKTDGTKMFVLGITGDDVNEYDLSTAWDISTASFSQLFSVASQDTNPTGLSFKSDGTKMYMCGVISDTVSEYDLSTAWDVSSASYLQNFSVATQDTSPAAVFFRQDGKKMYIAGNTGDDVNEYDLSTAWDVSSASFVQNFSILSQTNNPTGIFFKPDGTKMFICEQQNDSVFTYSLGVQE